MEPGSHGGKLRDPSECATAFQVNNRKQPSSHSRRLPPSGPALYSHDTLRTRKVRIAEEPLKKEKIISEMPPSKQPLTIQQDSDRSGSKGVECGPQKLQTRDCKDLFPQV
jgi:hypothetical protein